MYFQVSHLSLAFILAAALCCHLKTANAQVAIDWVPMNDGLQSDQVDLLWRSPAGTFFAGGSTSGLFRSTAYGAPWEASGLHKVLARYITADGEGNIYAASNDGLFFSRNEGLTWHETTLDFPIYSLVTGGDGHIYAGAIDGLYRVEAGGSTGKLIKQWVLDDPIEYHTEPGIQPIHRMAVRKNGDIAVVIDTHVYTSADGNHWECLQESGTTECWQPKSYGGPGNIKVPKRVFFLIAVQNDLILSHEAGLLEYCPTKVFSYESNTSSRSGLGIKHGLYGVDSSDKADYVVAYTCSIMGFGGGFSVYRRDRQDSTSRWMRYTDLSRPSPYAVMVAEDDSWVCLGTANGIKCTEDGGANWHPWEEGLSNTNVSTLFYAPNHGLFAGAQYGAFLNPDHERPSWNYIFLNARTYVTDRTCISSPRDYAALTNSNGAGSTLLAKNHQVYVTDDPQSHWELNAARLESGRQIDPGIAETISNIEEVTFCGYFLIYYGFREREPDRCTPAARKRLQARDGVIYDLTTYDLRVSYDGYHSYETREIPLSVWSSSSLTISPDGTLIISEGNQLWTSIDDGITWEARALPTDQSILDMAVPEDGILIAATTAGLYRSEDFGVTWMSPVEPNRCFNLVEAHENGTVLAGDQLISFDYGKTWEPIDTQLPGHIVDLTFDDQGRLYAGTLGHGIFRSSAPINIQPAQEPLSSSIEASIFPNPANRAFTLAFNLPTWQPVRAEVFDLLGRRQSTLLSKSFARGSHYVPLQVTSLSSGPYVIRLSVGEQQMHIPITIY